MAAAAFGMILTRYMGNRKVAAQNRARLILASVAAHRLEALQLLLDKRLQLAAAKDILERVVKVDGVTGASLYDASGRLLVSAGSGKPVKNLVDGGGQPPPPGRVFTVAASEADGKLSASLIEPVTSADGRRLASLRLRYSLGELADLNQRTWVAFALAVASAYILLAGLLNVLLHRLVLSPVDTLRRGLEAVQDGQLGHSLPVSSSDAMGRMVLAFNAMSARLKETSDSLAKSRDEIEESRRLLARRVEERTAELAKTNDKLTAEVAARREAEDRQQRALALHRAILESTAEGMVCVSWPLPGDVLAHNRRFLELWGLAENWAALPESERARLLLDNLADPEAARAGYAALMGDGERLETTVLALRDGRFLERRSGPIRQGRSTIGRVFSYVDVTEEIRRRDRTEQQKTMAEEASKAKGAFLAVMSHEIRTPLNVVIGLTEELLAGEATGEQRDHFRIIQQSAAHLLGVVNDVLDFSKIEAGKLVLERIDFNVRELVAGVADVFAREARVKGLDFSTRVDDAVPAFLRGDPGRLRQVLLNLLGNAVKFTESGSVSLDVAPAASGPPDRVGIAIRVADTGIGIAPDRREGIFEDFQQGAGAIARRFGGTGLGLAISKGIVTRMGGTISVEANPGGGSVFTCTAWLDPGRAVAPEPAACAPASEASRRPLHILLVEDNALNAAVTRLHLARMGHDLTVADSAAAAYALLAKESFHAVLMDIEMPDVDGITATRVIRDGGPADGPVLDPAVPIIAVTAHAVEDVRQKCLEAGMSGFVTKPVNYRNLRHLLEQAGEAVAAEVPCPAPDGDALFDPEAARDAMGVTWPQYRELALVSFSEGERRLSDAAKAMDAGDVESAAIAAHTVKGATATMGAYSCRRAAAELEKALRRGDGAAAGKALEELSDLWEKLRAAYSDWRAPDGE
ncbi:ATP-binding protein [Solidesulfovibrio fructosivorans]|nr:ATP-binding protein [Solidesulfovibrio fructosivorans]